MNNIKRVLIIEDESSLMKIMREKFSGQNFSCIEARNGEEGLKIALEQHPDLILLDIIMPKMDGIEVLTRLRNDEWGKNSKIIMLSNLSDSSRLEEAKKLGIIDYLVKTDWKIDTVLEKVLSTLSNIK
jgi:DNA-binding response OmpR family regulator